MRPHAITIGLLAIVLACGCRRTQQKPPPTVTTVSGASSVLPRAPGLKDAAVHLSPRAIEVGKLKRNYLLVEPNAAPIGQRALVLVIHGDGGGMSSFHNDWPFERATGDDAYLVYLDGRHASWDLETLTNNVDIAYAEAVVNEVASQLPIDRTRVFAAGYSSGGFFANVLACHRPGLLRAIASNAGGAPYNQAESWGNGFPKCPGQQPTAVLSLHGQDDSEVTLDSGRYDGEYWAYVNGCNGAELETTGYPECRIYRGCPQGKAVGFCSIAGLGHWVWSESAAASWTFFTRQ